MKRNAYTINHLTATVTVTKSFLKEAGIIGSPAYSEMLRLRRELPEYEITVLHPGTVLPLVFFSVGFFQVEDILSQVIECFANGGKGCLGFRLLCRQVIEGNRIPFV